MRMATQVMMRKIMAARLWYATVLRKAVKRINNTIAWMLKVAMDVIIA